ncbi:DUF6173 family protein [Sporomusa aerivorans]|uniref:DUF6173 family protein n=1 Tax=Sporomusa aerivorans TaxID=204936 RepID=UPI00352A24DE
MSYEFYNAAEKIHQDLREEIAELQDSLSGDEGLEIVISGSPSDFILTGIGYSGPDLLVFYGHCDKREVRILQHVSQVNVCLKIVKRKNTDIPRVTIDFFVLPEDE